MAVQALYYSERDGLEMALKHPDTLLFSSKAEADARDKVLELAEEITQFLQSRVEGMDEHLAEKAALAIAEEKELFGKALKKPSLLNQSNMPE
ncbi:YebG family protein [uncultured Marinobacter sp.]|uniref:YebG family protein n=1 Tax=uncultured Marinobacter sp. TaxID=187379 RepID=UPI00263011A8|nr:YebG family protein [uncultured Marinobacter sp.]